MFGPSLGAPFMAKVIWDTIIEKMEKIVGGWKRHFLSKGGIEALIKNMLSKLPTYSFRSSLSPLVLLIC